MSKLKELRQKLELTQIEAAGYLGISRRTYQKYEILNEEDDPKLNYFIYRLSEKAKVDEEHGILKLDEIKSIVSSILSKYEVNFCYLFGSYAKNKAKDKSDVDLIIDSDITGLDFFGLVEELRVSLHKQVDLLKINQLDNNQALLREILKDGIKIYG